MLVRNSGKPQGDFPGLLTQTKQSTILCSNICVLCYRCYFLSCAPLVFSFSDAIYWLLLCMPKKSCIQHQPKKLSISAIQPTINMSQFAHTALYWGAQGPSHQNASANLKILSTLPKFCFIFYTSFIFKAIQKPFFPYLEYY